MTGHRSLHGPYNLPESRRSPDIPAKTLWAIRRRRRAAPLSRFPSGGWLEQRRRSVRPPWLDDASCFVGPHGEFDSISGSEFGHESVEVELDGAHADVEFAGDFGVGSAARDGEEDFFFTVGEGFEGLDRRGCGGYS